MIFLKTKMPLIETPKLPVKCKTTLNSLPLFLYFFSSNFSIILTKFNKRVYLSPMNEQIIISNDGIGMFYIKFLVFLVSFLELEEENIVNSV